MPVETKFAIFKVSTFPVVLLTPMSASVVVLPVGNAGMNKFAPFKFVVAADVPILVVFAPTVLIFTNPAPALGPVMVAPALAVTYPVKLTAPEPV